MAIQSWVGWDGYCKTHNLGCSNVRHSGQSNYLDVWRLFVMNFLYYCSNFCMLVIFVKSPRKLSKPNAHKNYGFYSTPNNSKAGEELREFGEFKQVLIAVSILWGLDLQHAWGMYGGPIL